MTELSREERMRLINEKLAMLPGNDIRYSLDKTLSGQDPVLQGKTVLFLGSSVTYGFAALGEAFPDYMRKRDGMNSVKEAVSGTTLVWDENEKESYIERLQKMDTQIHANAFMCQLSTNDAKPDKPKPLGEIAKCVSSTLALMFPQVLATSFLPTSSIPVSATDLFACSLSIYPLPINHSTRRKAFCLLRAVF